eukprot:CAMPEP_0194105586 /NCGR_PEP_ID=MMETSP0150-20130528/5770_1 /TAXON_ID=122233 /ORGANISM="Chaetoceros debilis, Strain MM31A-1" /LENGTH=431 /DNA_ID=CAMNT_0038793505 /DNA_START=294 /DNA_END=1589 /DNA_ORIENTATION=-
MNIRRESSSSSSSSASKRRHVVQHDYHDHGCDLDESSENNDGKELSKKQPRKGPRGGVTTPFPVKLHMLLEQNLHENVNVISWQPHGRCFLLRSPKDFLNSVMPRHFKQTKLTSFQRQLNLYGFNRLTSGPDKGGYYHELFLRGKRQLCSRMIRMRIKGTRTKAASNPESEPNFYIMPPVSQSTRPSLSSLTSSSSSSSSSSSTSKRPNRRPARATQTLTQNLTQVVKKESKAETLLRNSIPPKEVVSSTDYQDSPVCVSAPSSVTSSNFNSRPSSPLTSAPFLPPPVPSISRGFNNYSYGGYQHQHQHQHHRPYPVLGGDGYGYHHMHHMHPATSTGFVNTTSQQKKQQQDHQWPSLNDLSRFPDPLAAQDDTLMFEGKGFHYLDPGVFAVDDDDDYQTIRDADIADTFDNLEDGSFPAPEKVSSHVFEC